LLPSPPSEPSEDGEFNEDPLLETDGRLPVFSIRARAYSPPPLESYEPTPEEYGYGAAAETDSMSGSSIREEEEEEEEADDEEEGEERMNGTKGNTTPTRVRRGSFSGMDHLGHLGEDVGENEGSSTPLGKVSRSRSHVLSFLYAS